MNINFYVKKKGERTVNTIRKIVGDKHKLYCNQKNISIINNGVIRKINFIDTKTGNKLAAVTITKKECQLYKINGTTLNEHGLIQDWVNIKKG